VRGNDNGEIRIKLRGKRSLKKEKASATLWGGTFYSFGVFRGRKGNGPGENRGGSWGYGRTSPYVLLTPTRCWKIRQRGDLRYTSPRARQILRVRGVRPGWTTTNKKSCATCCRSEGRTDLSRSSGIKDVRAQVLAADKSRSR